MGVLFFGRGTEGGELWGWKTDLRMEFGELLEKSESLVATESMSSRNEGIPRLRRALAQIEADTDRVLSAREGAVRSAVWEIEACSEEMEE